MFYDPNKVYVFDTTLRDGGQTPGVKYSSKLKKTVARWLDLFGVDYIEGGWPGANETDIELFRNPPHLKKARFTAFGMTLKKGLTPETDTGFHKVVHSNADTICLFGKTWMAHVTEALGATDEENLGMIRNSVAYAKSLGKEVVFDAEHFFDGYNDNPEYALACLRAAQEAGADWLVMCDTRGHTMTNEVFEIVTAVKEAMPQARLGIHCHNDSGLADANSQEAVRAGCRMVQGTLNGLGERCGNANLNTIMANLVLKMGYTLSFEKENLRGLKKLADDFADLLRLKRNPRAPYVGKDAFAHKGGVHGQAVRKNPKLYEHINPEDVGNERQILVSDQSGMANLLINLEAHGIGVDPKDPKLKELLASVKKREDEGYSYELAEASFAVLALRKLGRMKRPFEVKKYRILDEGEFDDEGKLHNIAHATVMMKIAGKEMTAEAPRLDVTGEAEGDGPVFALDRAMRKAMNGNYPEMENLCLVDYNVAILNPKEAAGATTCVVLDVMDKRTKKRWTTTGISQDIIGASLMALVDAYNYRLACNQLSQSTPKRALEAREELKIA
ncbi:MAG: citramalate synthase [Alphaproteobacteria bacterium]|nr:citramalate synthase [Alphaproteobacteria bacterium]